jgi:hypothetical protein
MTYSELAAHYQLEGTDVKHLSFLLFQLADAGVLKRHETKRVNKLGRYYRPWGYRREEFEASLAGRTVQQAVAEYRHDPWGLRAALTGMPKINDTKQQIVNVVRESGHIHASEIATVLGCEPNSYFKNLVTELRKFGIIKLGPEGFSV